MTPRHKATTITRKLAVLQPRVLRTDELVAVHGGQTASTSASGTPAAGDDTVGDALLPRVLVTSFQLG